MTRRLSTDNAYNRRVWGTPIGKTKAGRNIYRSILGHYAVEHDHKYLVQPTAEEMREIEKITRGKE